MSFIKISLLKYFYALFAYWYTVTLIFSTRLIMQKGIYTEMNNKEEPLRSKFLIEARKRFVPTSGIFQLTPRCSLNCKMCYVHLTKKQMGNTHELSSAEWIRIINDAYKSGLLTALLTGGECLLHSEFKEIFCHLKSLGVSTSINTNATLITNDYVDFFRCNPPRHIQVSVYGSDEKHYERVTGFRTHSIVTENLFKLRDAGINVHIAITPSRYLYDDVLNIVEFAKKEKFHYSINNALMQAYNNTERTIEDYGLTVEEIIELDKRLLQASGRELYCNRTRAEIPEYVHCNEPLRRLQCGAGRSAFTVTWDGKLSPCEWISDVSVDLLHMGFEKAWKEVNKSVTEHIIPIECESCKYRKYCTSCAMRRADPKNPAHRNSTVCAETVGRINAGIIKFDDDTAELNLNNV